MYCKRLLAYRDVGKGREQDAEALRATGSINETRPGMVAPKDAPTVLPQRQLYFFGVLGVFSEKIFTGLWNDLWNLRIIGVPLTPGNQNMSNIPATFRAFRIHDDAQGYRSGIEDISIDDLAEACAQRVIRLRIEEDCGLMPAGGLSSAFGSRANHAPEEGQPLALRVAFGQHHADKRVEGQRVRRVQPAAAIGEVEQHGID